MLHSQGAGTRSIYRPQSEKNLVDGGSTSACQVTIVNACDLFKQPLRSSRPDHIVIILRGLPGSQKNIVYISCYLSSMFYGHKYVYAGFKFPY
jgi:hypothetical protein